MQIDQFKSSLLGTENKKKWKNSIELKRLNKCKGTRNTQKNK